MLCPHDNNSWAPDCGLILTLGCCTYTYPTGPSGHCSFCFCGLSSMLAAPAVSRYNPDQEHPQFCSSLNRRCFIYFARLVEGQSFLLWMLSTQKHSSSVYFRPWVVTTFCVFSWLFSLYAAPKEGYVEVKQPCGGFTQKPCSTVIGSHWSTKSLCVGRSHSQEIRVPFL